MCGRFTLTDPRRVIAALGLDLVLPAELSGRFNIAPSQSVLAVTNTAERSIDFFRWGLIPFWAEDERVGYRMINARVESVADKPAFRQPFRKRRCLIPADGFFEWQRRGDVKLPFYIRRRDRQPFAFAGLWDSWQPAGGAAVRSCAIITMEANRLVAPLHDRMPVILRPEHYARWLDPGAQHVDELARLLQPLPEELLEAYPVSRAVNSPANDSAECIAPADELPEPPPRPIQQKLFD